jgi:hypothetical protein
MARIRGRVDAAIRVFENMVYLVAVLKISENIDWFVATISVLESTAYSVHEDTFVIYVSIFRAI